MRTLEFLNEPWHTRLHALVPASCNTNRYALKSGLRDKLQSLIAPRLRDSDIPGLSSQSDASLASQKSESSWESCNYKKATKRIEDADRLCDDLAQLVRERCDIERNYAKSLQRWSEKWNDNITRGPEYGTIETAMKGVLSEADRLSEMHSKIKQNLKDNVFSEIRRWQSERFHKKLLYIKEKKEIDEEFEKVQKPWSRLVDQVNKCKQDYNLACKREKSLLNQERNASLDVSVSLDQVGKVRERVTEAHEEVARTKKIYEEALIEIGQYNDTYLTEMNQVFKKCQIIEAQRLSFFKDILFNIHDCLDISTNQELPLIYEEYRRTLEHADVSKDLEWWSNTYGDGTSVTSSEPSTQFRFLMN